MDPMEPMNPMGEKVNPERRRIDAEVKAEISKDPKPPRPKVKRDPGDLSPKFKLGAVFAVVGMFAVFATNAVAQLGIEPKGFAAMALGVLATLSGVYKATGDGR